MDFKGIVLPSSPFAQRLRLPDGLLARLSTMCSCFMVFSQALHVRAQCQDKLLTFPIRHPQGMARTDLDPCALRELKYACLAGYLTHHAA